MRLELTYRPVSLELTEPFVISRGIETTYEVVEVAITAGEVTGYGEATPLEHFGESPESVVRFLGTVAPLLGDDPFALEEIEQRLDAVSGEMAARAAVDAALHDLCGKLVDRPVWRLLGLRRAAPATTFTLSLGDPDSMARAAARPQRDGFRRLKLKLGGRDGLDIERVAAVAATSPLPLQVDVNEYWSLDEALDAIPQLAAHGVELVEQPLPAGDENGAELKRRSPLPIYVDEDCHRLSDVAACADRAHGINIKLAKSGGIREAIRMVHAARALGLGVMIGCMGESSLGLAAALPVSSLCDHVDLDGNVLLADDPWVGIELTQDGSQAPSFAPGLGVSRR